MGDTKFRELLMLLAFLFKEKFNKLGWLVTYNLQLATCNVRLVTYLYNLKYITWNLKLKPCKNLGFFFEEKFT